MPKYSVFSPEIAVFDLVLAVLTLNLAVLGPDRGDITCASRGGGWCNSNP